MEPGSSWREALQRVLESHPAVRLAVLFGSAARGEPGPESDVDLGLILDSAAWTPPACWSLEAALGRACRRTVELVPLDRAPPLLRFEIARDGRVLLDRSPHAWVDFRARAMTDWWDWAPTARFLNSAAAARLRAALADGSP